MSSYALPADLTRHGASDGALSEFPVAYQQSALDAASAVADGYLAARYRLPLIAQGTPPVFDVGLVVAVCQIAAYNLLSSRGYNPELTGDTNVRSRYLDALKWLRGVAEGEISPQVVDSTPGGVSSGPFVQQATVMPDTYDQNGMPVLQVGAPVPRGW